ncbi:MAG: hypothetical protein NZM05_09415 [Chloroherpetonaceae bacterium]|nr:hypothetical protein [Chloroherpetonaceae bacterium]
MTDNSTSTLTIQKDPADSKRIKLIFQAKGSAQNPSASVSASFEYLLNAEVSSNSEFKIPKQAAQPLGMQMEGTGRLQGGVLYLSTRSEVQGDKLYESTSECRFTAAKPASTSSRSRK